MADWTPADLAVAPIDWSQDGSTTNLGSGSSYVAGPWSVPANNVNTLNSLAVFTYTSGKGLQSSSANTWASGSNYVCIVARRATGQVDYQPLVETDQARDVTALGTMYASAGDGAYLFGYGTGYNGSPPIGGTDANTPCATDGQWHIIEFLLGPTYYVKVDGFDLTASGPSTGSTASRSAKTNIGHNGDGENFIGDIAAWVTCAYNPTDADKIRGNFAWRYGLQGNLPSGDPYKSARPTTGITLTGQSATGSRGTAVPSNSQAITGKLGTTGQGALTGVASRTPTGQSATGSAGTLSVGARSLALTGVAATGAIGTITASAGGNVSVALTGQGATGSAGTMGLGTRSLAITGFSATGSRGSLSPDRSKALTGLAATGSAGSVGLGARTVALTGIGASGFGGVVTGPASGGASLTGCSATGSIGTLTAFYWAATAPTPETWVPIPDNDEIWTPIASSVANWS